MSDGEVVVRFTSEEDAKLFDAFVRVAKMASDSGDKLTKTSAAADRADASLKRFAEHMKDVTSTPMEALTRETEKLDRALKANLLTAEEHSRAVALVHKKYATEDEKPKASAETPVDASLARFADRVKELNATPLETLTQETEKLDAALRQNLLTAEQHGRAVAVAQQRYQAELKKTREEQEKANAPTAVEISPADKAKQEALEAHEYRLRRIKQAYGIAAISADQFAAAVSANTEQLNADLAEAANEASDADREMSKLAKSARELARTPIDRYNDKMVQLGALLAQNRIRHRAYTIYMNCYLLHAHGCPHLHYRDNNKVENIEYLKLHYLNCDKPIKCGRDTSFCDLANYTKLVQCHARPNQSNDRNYNKKEFFESNLSYLLLNTHRFDEGILWRCRLHSTLDSNPHGDLRGTGPMQFRRSHTIML
jgi:predicted RNA-binding protein associated with RNAse of E/G family